MLCVQVLSFGTLCGHCLRVHCSALDAIFVCFHHVTLVLATADLCDASLTVCASVPASCGGAATLSQRALLGCSRLGQCQDIHGGMPFEVLFQGKAPCLEGCTLGEFHRIERVRL